MKIVKTIGLILILGFYSIESYGQIDKEIRLQWIKQCTDYRDYLLLRNPTAIYELKWLLEKWDSIDTYKEEKDKFASMIFHFSEKQNLPEEDILKTVRKFMPKSTLAKKSTKDDVEIVRNNIDLLNMVNLGLLEDKFPFKLDANTDLFIEFNTYNVQQGDQVGEIGAGDGAFSLLLYQLSPDIKLFINELFMDKLQLIKSKIEGNPNRYQFDHVELICGSHICTGMEGFELDKIIIRNTFHHFENKKQMLRAIQKSMKKDGTLFIYESIKDLDKKGCRFAMKRKKIIKILASSGLVITNQTQMKGEVIFTSKRKLS
ncbi:MAG: class I SAM-dependent methyltransferase [Saprospiraceae bacterium]